MALTALTWIAWVVLLGGPLIGILAVVSLSLFHEHKDPLRLRPEGGVTRRMAGRRASTALLESYLLDEYEASPNERRKVQARLVVPMARASTLALDEYLEEREWQGAARPARVPAAAPPRPARQPVRGSVPRPAMPAALGAVPMRAHGYQRAARPTRLVPLSPEIAVG
jgi:hypothetical protein